LLEREEEEEDKERKKERRKCCLEKNAPTRVGENFIERKRSSPPRREFAFSVSLIITAQQRTNTTTFDDARENDNENDGSN